MDLQKKKEATRLFAREFPEIASIRNSTAHPGQLSGSPRDINSHRLGGVGVYLTDLMVADDDKLTLTATFNKKFASYELSFGKANKLAEVAALYCDAFQALEEPSEGF